MTKIFRNLIFVLVFTVAVCFSVNAATEYKDGAYTYIVKDYNAVITEVETTLSGDIAIPSKLGGYVVSGIDAYAFEFCSAITSVTVPDSITSISWSVFNGCEKLKTVTLGNGIEKIPSWLFYNSVALETINIGNKVSEIEFGAFENLPSLKYINVNSGNPVYFSENGVLLSKTDKKLLCYPAGKNETSYTIGGNAEIIGDGAFVNSALKEIIIPATVKKIEDGVFSTLDNLEAIKVDSGNNYYFSENGVLFNKSKTSVISYPINKSGSEYELPSLVTNIAPYAFMNCDNLKEVVFSDNLKSIEGYGFYSCSQLEKISLPNELESINESAFALCRSVKDVVIPEDCSDIGKFAFVACDRLSDVTFFETLSFIDLSAFKYCDNIKAVNYTGSQTDWEDVVIAVGNESITGKTVKYNKFIVVDFDSSMENDGKLKVSADLRNLPADSKIYVASFNSDYKMLEVKELTGDNLNTLLNSENVNDVKLFVWNKNMSPVE